MQRTDLSGLYRVCCPAWGSSYSRPQLDPPAGYSGSVKDRSRSFTTLITARLIQFASRCRHWGVKQVGVALTFWQTLFNLWRWSRVSWGFCRYWGSSACKTRMEKGTIEPRPWKTKTQRDINTNACSFSSAKTKCTIFLFSLLFFCQETHCRNRLHAGETRAWGFDHVPLWYQDSGRILKHRPESSTASPSEDFTWPTA